MNTNIFDVVVIGSGALGASTAFHLTQLGRHVCLVDQAAISSQTSVRAAGLTGQARQTENMTRLAIHAVQKIRKFKEETGEPLVFVESGSMSVARLVEDEQLLRERVVKAQQYGVGTQLISAEEAAEKMPFLVPRGIRAVSFTPSDLYLEAAQIPVGYSAAAQKRGATLLAGTRVQMITDERNGRLRVSTDQGELLARAVVDAAGGWARRIAKMTGWAMPIIPVVNQLLVTTPISGVEPTQPITRILDANICVRPDRGGLLLGGYEKSPTWLNMDAPDPHFRVENLELDIGILRRLANDVAEQLPVFKNAQIREHRGGIPTMTADGHHIVGAIPGVPGLYVIGGCNVAGLSISPALGEQLAQLIVHGTTTFDISDMSPDRFTPQLTEDELKARCSQRYTSYYTYRFSEAAAASRPA
ncbi:NAD(P)/FAD-dependent oxidoreductase [Paraburkholderia caribensis]|uniref:NAD(P)/FAD-dependent oxidoreductase n=1 Tax=Paraburkholderia caribensis TaxID=75105 RepID=UPI00071F89F2|nr:FAD-binding oxidoreductase [Paraburkholderia caribensis]ALP68562.1 hypothetical protein AN416_38220 [Paraburkholderia caribensis]AUT57920.1 FAD-binding oxidoreductase [Paraburkholderia caribensis]